MDVKRYVQRIIQAKYLNEKDLKMVCEKVKQILLEQPNICDVSAPVMVCGDIKGHFYDLLQIFELYGKVNETKYVFLGNYINRGYLSVQTLSLLLCLKIMYPDRITLLRGNLQERCLFCLFRKMSNYHQRITLYGECQEKYGNRNAWAFFNEVFDYLPISAIINGTRAFIKDQIFLVHSGLSPKLSSLNQIRIINRNKYKMEQNDGMTDLLWSDPRDIQNWGISQRGISWQFGEKVVKTFCYFNGLSVIGRANEFQSEGYKFYFEESLVTIWSAPNFVGRCNNKGSIMQVSQQCQINMKQFDSSELNKKFPFDKNNYPCFQ